MVEKLQYPLQEKKKKKRKQISQRKIDLKRLGIVRNTVSLDRILTVLRVVVYKKNIKIIYKSNTELLYLKDKAKIIKLL